MMTDVVLIPPRFLLLTPNVASVWPVFRNVWSLSAVECLSNPNRVRGPGSPWKSPSGGTRKSPQCTPMIKILLVEDLKLTRAGMRALLETSDQVKVIGEAANGREAIRLSKK